MSHINSMEEHKHHHKHPETVTIKIDPGHHIHKKDETINYDNKLKIAIISGSAIVTSSAIAGVVALIIHFSNCK